jgi:hypothetical protein
MRFDKNNEKLNVKNCFLFRLESKNCKMQKCLYNKN